MFKFDKTQPIHLIGDIHGAAYSYEMAVKSKSNTIQIGDFGLGFYPCYGMDDAPAAYRGDKQLNKILNSGNHYFIRGNHDNPKVCRDNPRWIPDGHIHENMMFIGGAWSIDRGGRTQGLDWWSDEELSMSAFYDMMDIYEKAKPEIMITHDAPTIVASKLWKIGFGYHAPSRTNQALDSMFAMHKPKQWFFGHHHMHDQRTVDGCDFRCININEVVELKSYK
jgi:hypothetical protein